jgi:hypothetical protein
MPEHQQTHQSKKSGSTFQKQATSLNHTPISNPASIIQHARIGPKSLSQTDVLQLQRTIGNRAVGKLLSEVREPSRVQQVPIQRQKVSKEEKESLQGMFESKPEKEKCPLCMQRQEIPEEEEPLQGKMIGTVQRQEILKEEESLQTIRENNTGMPENLKAGVENLSGIDMSNVRVHYNSSKPAEVGALAYTQGTNIHVAPGQERHLLHEAWHAVQQAQGRVRPTIQSSGVSINDAQTLESEADLMGARALQQIHVRRNGSDLKVSDTFSLGAYVKARRKLKAPIDRSPHVQTMSHLPEILVKNEGLAKATEHSGTIVQRTLKVGPNTINEEHVDFAVDQVARAAHQILDIYKNVEKGSARSPTWVAYEKGIPKLLIENQKEVKEIIVKWVTSSGGGAVVPVVESLKEAVTRERSGKVYWKEFGDFLEMALAVGYELDPDIVSNRAFEAQLGKEIEQNPAINERLNSMRIALMNWVIKAYQKDKTTLETFKVKFKLGGSYNLGNLRGVKRNFDDILAAENLSFTDNIEILHDLMELTSDPGAGSILQHLNAKVLTKPLDESAYTQIGATEDGIPYEMVPMMSESDHGPGGGAWRTAKYYTVKMFEMEFERFKKTLQKPEIELQEMGTLPDQTREEKLIARYDMKRALKMEKAVTHEKKEATTALGKLRDKILFALELKQKPRTAVDPTLHKSSKGRHNVGTRDEFDPVTVVARRYNVPIEAGRSMTAARLLQLCRQVLQDSEDRELQEKGKTELDAVANAIFAYWAAQYNQALTPIHTYHEVMDVARTFGVEYKPFHYRILNKKMDTVEQRPMNLELATKGGDGKLSGIERKEIREQPYRISHIQRHLLQTRNQEFQWIEPNGDCLFNALAHTGVKIPDISEKRGELAIYLEQNVSRYAPFLGNTPVKVVSEQIRTPGSYYNLGGDLTPILIAYSMNIGITIINEDGSKIDINGGSGKHVILRVTNPLPHYHTYRQVRDSSTASDEMELTEWSPFPLKAS